MQKTSVSRQIPSQPQAIAANGNGLLPVDFWPHPAVIAPNHFVFKSLSNWSFNIAVGCSHGCTFCYVPNAATIKQGAALAQFGISDPDAQWGKYVLLRQWDEKRFLSSLNAAEKTPGAQLNPDGNRAVIYCSTTDPYQTIYHPDPLKRKELGKAARHLVRRSLELIRDNSTLNVRILTRSPLARLDFDLYKTFGPRLVFGMSLPTLRDDLARVYEPKAPAPSQRLVSLQAAKAEGLHVYVAMAPTYPDSDREDLAKTLESISKLDPITVFMEPINIRAENVRRIEAQAQALGMTLKTDVFSSQDRWQAYARGALKAVYELAKANGLSGRLHLWPDKALGSQTSLKAVPNQTAYKRWLEKKWSRISEWPSR
jgi:DNA repair photolyase